MNAKQLLTHFDRLAEAPEAVLRLRRFILDLAVRGKLVDQDERDEPASELLKRIQAERLRILDKSLKSSAVLVTKPESTDIRLPTGWAWSKLGSLCTKTGSGCTPSGGKDAYISCGVPFLRSQNVYDDGLRLEGVAFISDATQTRMRSTTVKAGDLLLNITGGSIGRCAVVPESFVIGNINQHVAIIRLALLESGRFLHSVICSDYFQKHIFGNQTGAGREGLPKNRMDEILIPFPPLAEQHRIVAKVDELMALCDQLEAAQQERERCRDRLAAASLQRLNQPAVDATPEAQREHTRFHLQHLSRLVNRPEQVKAIRQLILNLAVRGKLVEQDAGDESAAELLFKISAVKKRRVIEGSLREQKVSLPMGENDLGHKLPHGWMWTRMSNVIKLWNGFAFKSSDFTSDGIPVVRIGDLQNGEIALQGAVCVTELVASSVGNEVWIPEEALLIAMSGATTGKVAVNNTGKRVLLNQRVGRIEVFLASRDFVRFFFETIIAKNLSISFGTAIPNLSAEQINDTVIALPPLAEQHRIVAKVDELMALCNQLKAHLAITQTDSRRLLEAVLAEAFTTHIEEAN